MWRLALALLGALALATTADAHPAPFSYVDVVLREHAVDVTVVVHVFDVAHELGVATPERLVDPSTLAGRAEDVLALVDSRLQLAADGWRLSCRRSDGPVAMAERHSLRLRFSCVPDRSAGALRVEAALFPYDPAHQTFLNVFQGEALQAQAILDRDRSAFEYFAGTRQGALAVARRFLPAGLHHILIGPDHLLFLVGLLLLGGSLRRLALVVTAFTVAHSLTLSLAVLNVFTPPARLVEPAIALSIAYVGADNLMVRGGRDLRAWIAFGFGLVHGLGFANVLREMELPRRALGLSLVSFNLGVEVGQLLVVVVIAAALAALRARNERAGRTLAVGGSVVVLLAGSWWFLNRLLFP
jgi:hydrogenase/urease accessory protein HupE